MYELLTQVLLWILIGYIAWFLLKQFIDPKVYTFLGFALLITLLVMAFFDPDQNIVSEAWSILSLPFRPLGLALIFLLSVFPFKDMGKFKFVQDRIFWAIMILLVSSAPATAYWLHSQAEQDVTTLIRNSTINTPGVIVLLGQNTTHPLIPPRTQIELTEQGDRIRYTAELYANQPGSTVLVATDSRNDLSGDRNLRQEGNDVRTLLSGLGVPATNIRIVDRSRTIRESAKRVRDVLQESFSGTRELLLVSSALDIQRATLTFTEALKSFNDGTGVRIVPRATDFVTVQDSGNLRRRFNFPKDVVPSEEALYLTTQAIQEQFLSVYYFLRGWLSSVS